MLRHAMGAVILATGVLTASQAMASWDSKQAIVPNGFGNAVALAADRHAAPELEKLLPTSLGGVALTIESQSGTDLSTTSAAFDTFLNSLGKTRTDFRLASAYSPGGLKAEVGAWHVQGADPAGLLPGFRKAVQASSTTPLTSRSSSRTMRWRSAAGIVPRTIKVPAGVAKSAGRYAARPPHARSRTP